MNLNIGLKISTFDKVSWIKETQILRYVWEKIRYHILWSSHMPYYYINLFLIKLIKVFYNILINYNYIPKRLL